MLRKLSHSPKFLRHKADHKLTLESITLRLNAGLLLYAYRFKL